MTGSASTRAAAAGFPAAAVLLVAAALPGCTFEEGSDGGDGDPAAGRVTRVLDAVGVKAEVEDLAARGPLVVNLWATWCVPCMRELPHFAEAARRHPGIRFLGVSADWTAAGLEVAMEDDLERCRAAWKRLEMPFDSLYCSEPDLDPLADALDLPTGVLPQTLVFVDGHRQALVETDLGPEELEDLLAAKVPGDGQPARR